LAQRLFPAGVASQEPAPSPTVLSLGVEAELLLALRALWIDVALEATPNYFPELRLGKMKHKVK
jgi:hypothetical protein